MHTHMCAQSDRRKHSRAQTDTHRDNGMYLVLLPLYIGQSPSMYIKNRIVWCVYLSACGVLFLWEVIFRDVVKA